MTAGIKIIGISAAVPKEKLELLTLGDDYGAKYVKKVSRVIAQAVTDGNQMYSEITHNACMTALFFLLFAGAVFLLSIIFFCFINFFLSFADVKVSNSTL